MVTRSNYGKRRNNSYKGHNNKSYSPKRQKNYYHTKSNYNKKNKLMNLFGKKVIVSFLIVIGLGYLADNFTLPYVSGLSQISWAVFTFYLLKNVFVYVNKLNMANDLSMWVSKIISFFLALFGLFFGFILYGASEINGSSYSAGLGILFFGISILGGFMLFRANRRYGHVYINR